MTKTYLNLTGLLLFFLISLLLPIFVSAEIIVDDEKAQKAVAEYCQLKHKIEVGTETFNAGSILADPSCGKLGETCSATEFANSLGTSPNFTSGWAGICFLDGIITIKDVVMWLAIIMVVVSLIFAGSMFVFSAGDPNKIDKAKKIFYWSLLGVLIATLSNFIPSVIRFFIGI